jgi:hypothetical protein
MKDRELIIQAHGEIDETLDRLKIWRKKLEIIMYEIDGDISALTGICNAIEENLNKIESELRVEEGA